MDKVTPTYLYCGSESVLNERKFREDTAEVRQQNRLTQSAVDQMIRTALIQAQDNPFQAVAMGQTTSFGNIVQRTVALFPQPVQTVVGMVQQVVTPIVTTAQNIIRPAVQAIVTLPQTINQLISQVIAFFFGNKKDRKEEAAEAHRDFMSVDLGGLLGERKVEGASGAGFGGQG